MNRLITLVLLLVVLPALLMAQAGSMVTTVDIQVLASDRAGTSRDIAEWADANGGYYTLRSLEAVTVRVPADKLPDLRTRIEDRGDTIVSYRPGAYDVSQELAQAHAAIVSRAESLDRVLEYMADADIVATLAFERELRSLNQELEYYAGRRRALLNQIEYAQVQVILSSRQSSIPSQRPSSFGWINTIDIYRFIGIAEQLGATR